MKAIATPQELFDHVIKRAFPQTRRFLFIHHVCWSVSPVEK